MDGLYEGAVPRALVSFGLEEDGLLENKGVCVELRGTNGGHRGAEFVLFGLIPGTPYRNAHATLNIATAGPFKSSAQPCEYLGAFYLIACIAAEGPMCLESPNAAREAAGAPRCLENPKALKRPHRASKPHAMRDSKPRGGIPVPTPRETSGNPPLQCPLPL
jgi:hypothetical protein